MRGSDLYTESLFTTLKLEDVVPANHPLQTVRIWVNDALKSMDADFNAMYAHAVKGGRPSIAPEKLIRASLLQIFYSIRSERQLMEQMNDNLLFKWFVGLAIDDPVWHATVFTKNRERLMEGDVLVGLFNRILEKAAEHHLLSDKHFSVDGSLIQAWASQKSIRPKDRDDDDLNGNWKGEKRSNKTHESVTDPDSRIARKSDKAAAKPSFLANVLTDNRHHLVVNTCMDLATGTGERDAALSMLSDISGDERQRTLGADRNYDTKAFVKACRDMKVTPHVTQNTKRNGGSAIDGRTTRHEGYRLSQTSRKRIEQVFSWIKTIGSMRQVKLRGLKQLDQWLVLHMVAYNLTRMRRLLA